MSHHPERVDKECLNCQTHVAGRFCHNCGQENIEIKESFWSLVSHFIFDILHFDGKFFSTLAAVSRRPGFAARQYVAGKRASYLHPIRMYLFTSAVFFLVFFSVEKIGLDEDNGIRVQMNSKDRRELAADLQKIAVNEPAGSLLRRSIAELQDTTKKLNRESIDRISSYTSSTGINSGSVSLKKYDSVQHTLPRADRDGWFARRVMMMKFKLSPVYNGTRGIQAFKETILHRLPYMLFVSLPFFALLLQLLYIRRKNFYYSDHAVFTLFHYILSFVLLLLIFGMSSLQTLTGWHIFKIINRLLVFAWPVYLFAEMKTFYAQSYFKTLGKFVLLNLLGVILMAVLFLLFSLVSAFLL